MVAIPYFLQGSHYDTSRFIHFGGKVSCGCQTIYQKQQNFYTLQYMVFSNMHLDLLLKAMQQTTVVITTIIHISHLLVNLKKCIGSY